MEGPDAHDALRPIGLALIGCGSFSTAMAELLRDDPRYRIAAVHDVDAGAARALGAAVAAAVLPSLDACLAAPEVEAVALFTPNDRHADAAIAAARAGRHVFCEKPMALTVAECRAMIAAADEAGTVLMVGHKRRLRPAYACIAELVASGRYGKIVTADIQGFYDRPPSGWWARRSTGGGLLPYSGVHDLDFLRFIAGEATSVVARTARKVQPAASDFEDAISLIIDFASGAIASIQVTWLFTGVRFHDAFSVRIALERGSIDYDPVASVVVARARGGAEERFAFDLAAGFEPAYRREFESFAAAIREDEPPIVTALDGLRCVELMEAAAHSAASGEVVRLPLPA
jgi:predicted dehydrogenase